MELRLTPHGLHETGQERRTEDLLSQVNEDHFRSLIENAADIIGVLDTDGTIRYQSPSIEHLLGYAPAELGGKNAFELIHPDDAERLEKWDGTGYPRGLKGEQIPLSARIFAVADVWDALKSDRPYRAGWSEEQVLEYLQQGDGTHFDPRALQVFMDVNASLSDL